MFQLRQQGVSMSGPDKTVLEPGDISTAATLLVYVSPVAGSDLTGDGSEFKPYATIAKAYSTITTASLATFFAIILLPGTYVENVALKPFIALIGVDKQLVDVAGNWTLGAGFADPAVGQVAWVTGVSIDGLLTLDYVTATSSAGVVIVQDCLVFGDVALTEGSLNFTDFYDCRLLGHYTQTGSALWENTSGTVDVNLLTLMGPATLRCAGGSWAGSVTLDQNAQAAQVILNSNGFVMSKGNVQIIDSATHSPAIVASLGDTPENCVIGVAGAGVLSPEMRISHQFTNIAPNPTAIAGTAVTTISLVVPAALIGATDIETMQCSCSPVGANWGTFIGPHAVSVTFTYRMNGGVPTIDVNFHNSDAGFNITDAINLNFYAYLPSVL